MKIATECWTDLEQGSGEWQNIQSVLRNTFQLLLESNQRHEHRLDQLEQLLAQVEKTSQTLLVSGNTHALRDRVDAMEQRKIDQVSLTTEQNTRIQYIEDELRLIVPVIDKKADIEAVNACLAQTKDSWKEALKRRCKSSIFEREIQRLHLLVTEPHPELKTQMQHLSQRQQQQESILSRLSYFIQKVEPPKQDFGQLHTTIEALETKMTSLALQVENTLSSFPNLEPLVTEIETTKSTTMLLTEKVQILQHELESASRQTHSQLQNQLQTQIHSQVETQKQIQVVQANIENMERQLSELSNAVHGSISKIQDQVDNCQSQRDRLQGQMEQALKSQREDFDRQIDGLQNQTKEPLPLMEQLNRQVHALDVKVKDVVQAMSQLVNQLPLISLLSFPYAPQTTAQLVELESILASSRQQHENLVLGTPTRLATLRDQFASTLEREKPTDDCLKQLFQAQAKHTQLAQELDATLLKYASDR
ncbi:hypothetical protein AeMF1_015171 [Aphanomyces euteiches]|nr:hypothetical protein AeMF1_015171 [Aphanomyces euteiches]KAH9185181.1 hypothetical protein AeNC1_012845 [Aphanomyces euteiches]